MLASTRSVRAVRGTLMMQLIHDGLNKDEEELVKQLSSDDESFDDSSSSAVSSSSLSQRKSRKRNRVKDESGSESDASSGSDDDSVDSDFSDDESAGQLGSATDSDAEMTARKEEQVDFGGTRNELLKRHRQAQKMFADEARYMRRASTIPHEARLRDALQRHELALTQSLGALNGTISSDVVPLVRKRRNKIDQADGDTIHYHSSQRAIDKCGAAIIVTFSRDLPNIFSTK